VRVSNVDAVQPYYLRSVPFLLFSDREIVARNIVLFTEWHIQPRHPTRLVETWFDLGRAALAEGVSAGGEALEAFEHAARLERGPEHGPERARFWVWAARAAQLLAAPERQASCRREALALVPELATALRRARDASLAEDDPEALAEAEALLAALEEPISAARKRLTVLGEAPPQPAPPAPGPPPRPRPERVPRPRVAARTSLRRPKRGR